MNFKDFFVFKLLEFKLGKINGSQKLNLIPKSGGAKISPVKVVNPSKQVIPFFPSINKGQKPTTIMNKKH